MGAGNREAPQFQSCRVREGRISLGREQGEQRVIWDLLSPQNVQTWGGRHSGAVGKASAPRQANKLWPAMA